MTKVPCHPTTPSRPTCRKRLTVDVGQHENNPCRISYLGLSFGTGGMTFADWGTAAGVAASVLVLEEGHKLLVTLFEHLRSSSLPAASP
jgi:hypothetical protein